MRGEGDTGAVYSASTYQLIQVTHDFLGAHVLQKYHRFAVKKCFQQGYLRIIGTSMTDVIWKDEILRSNNLMI